MSFFINNQNPNKPGPICNNPNTGLNEKVLIEVTRVFDACMQTETLNNIVLKATDFVPPTPKEPLTFISAETDQNIGIGTSNVVITRLDDKPNFANVSGKVRFPIVITYKDANGVIGTCHTTYETEFSTILCVPGPSLSPVEVKVVGQFASSIGKYTDTNTFTITACIQIIIKIVADVDILVPSYGYPYIPECQNIPTVCPGVGEVRIYPSSMGCNNPSNKCCGN